VRVVVVSSYPPRHCGIGAYAHTQVQRLREEGHDVTVISPLDGAGDVRVPFWSGRPFREAARRSGRGDRVVVHFQPALYLKPRSPLAKVAAALSLLALVLRRRGTELLVHEADRPRWWRPDEVLVGAAFRAAPLLLFHTERERRALESAYRIRVRARVVPHTAGVRVSGPADRAAARHRLGLPPAEPVLLCAGFIHPDKGFDRAIEAFGRPAKAGGRLVVVGSTRDDAPANRAYAGRLRALAAATPGVELVERYVSDDELDDWIAAADALVLPYRRSWSSGALARAQVLGTPAIVTAVGGLPEQAGERDVVVRDDDELAHAMAAALDRTEATG